MAQSSKRAENEIGAGPYRIHVAAELCGVAPTTLRAWERRYGVPAPRRTPSAYRLYSAEDVELISRMRELVESGTAPAEAARRVLSTPALSAPEDGAAEGGEDAFELASARLLAATQRWDGRAIDDELVRLSLTVDAQRLYAQVISPLLVEVGERWADRQLSIAQEHMLSERLELLLRGALKSLAPTEGPHVLLGSIEGDAHVLGMLGAALRFAAAGARITLLGASTPPSAIADAVSSLRPALVALSATIAPENPRAVFREYAKACGDTRWVVGGAAVGTLARAVEGAGGIAVAGPATTWGVQLRDWLRARR